MNAPLRHEIYKIISSKGGGQGGNFHGRLRVAIFVTEGKLKRHVGRLIENASGCDTRRTLFKERFQHV
jgi:hypothetical protein